MEQEGSTRENFQDPLHEMLTEMEAAHLLDFEVRNDYYGLVDQRAQAFRLRVVRKMMLAR